MVELGHVELEHGERCGARACAQLLPYLHTRYTLEKRTFNARKEYIFFRGDGGLYWYGSSLEINYFLCGEDLSLSYPHRCSSGKSLPHGAYTTVNRTEDLPRGKQALTI